ncbi:hypothetical protein VNO78_25995 [Psophocarpus tetragonolobus]|uniref:30S ribosomal protein S31, chloroplastic n=1 Tax=Psophocarpus tetragonolobus TaxID=3891 RepID=A0AAN9S6T3_PSOTE
MPQETIYSDYDRSYNTYDAQVSFETSQENIYDYSKLLNDCIWSRVATSSRIPQEHIHSHTTLMNNYIRSSVQTSSGKSKENICDYTTHDAVASLGTSEENIRGYYDQPEALCHIFGPSQTLSLWSSSAMASLLLASPSPLSIQLHCSSSHLSFSHSQTLSSPLSTPFPSLSASSSSTLSPTPSVYCGRGDRKTAKGKRFAHSFGNARPKDKKKGKGPPKPYAPPAPAKKDRFEDNEIVKIEIDESLFSG